MALIRSKYATGKLPVRVAQGAEVIVQPYEIDVPATGDGTALNDILELGPLPAGHVPVDFLLAPDDLDTGGPTITLTVGILNANKDDISTASADGGAVWLSASTAAQTGVLGRPTATAHLKVTPSQNDRAIGVKIAAAATTKAAGKVRLHVLMRAAP